MMQSVGSGRACAVIVVDERRERLAVALCLRVAREGLAIQVACSMPLPLLATVLARIEKGGVRTYSHRVDPAKGDEVAALFARIAAQGQRPALVAFAVGSDEQASLLQIGPEGLANAWRTCCLGGFNVGQAAVRRFLPQRRGTLIFVGSRDRPTAPAHFSGSAPAKAGLRSLSQSLARAFGPRGIHVAHVVADHVLGSEVTGDTETSLAEMCWQLHLQHLTAWSQEWDVEHAAAYAVSQ